MNKKGDIAGVMIGVVILILVIGMLFIGFFVWGITAPIISSTSGDLSGLIQEVGEDDGNVSYAIESSFVQGNQSIQQLQWITYLVFFGLLIGFIILAFSVRTYPFLLGFWIIGIVVLAILGLFLTVAYQDIASGDDYVAQALQSWGFNHFLLGHLPHLIVIFGLIGGIILFLVISTDAETEVSQL